MVTWARWPRSQLLRARLGRFLTVALVEAIDASRGIDELLLSGKERMASRTDFHVQVALFGRPSFERLAASATDVDFYVFRVNSWFHLLLCLPCGTPAALSGAPAALTNTP